MLRALLAALAGCGLRVGGPHSTASAADARAALREVACVGVAYDVADVAWSQAWCFQPPDGAYTALVGYANDQ